MYAVLYSLARMEYGGMVAIAYQNSDTSGGEVGVFGG